MIEVWVLGFRSVRGLELREVGKYVLDDMVGDNLITRLSFPDIPLPHTIPE